MASDDFDPGSWLDEISSFYRKADPAHDFSHILRVCKMARKIGQEEKADMKVLLPAALLHDLESKKGLQSGQEPSGQASASAARSFLQGKGLDRDRIEKVLYAVEVHSFSRRIFQSPWRPGPSWMPTAWMPWGPQASPASLSLAGR